MSQARNLKFQIECIKHALAVLGSHDEEMLVGLTGAQVSLEWLDKNLAVVKALYALKRALPDGEATLDEFVAILNDHSEVFAEHGVEPLRQFCGVVTRNPPVLDMLRVFQPPEVIFRKTDDEGGEPNA